MTRPIHAASDFTALWVKAQPLLNSYILSAVHQSHAAEDILQEVAQAALVDFAAYDPQRPFIAWAMGIAKNRILAHYRTHSATKLVFSDAILSTLADAHQTLEPTVTERRQALDDCLLRIHDRGRQTLAMRYFENLSVQAIAQRLKTSPNAVSLVLHKARQSLAACIEARLTSSEDTR